ncbi:MAG TPA: hypothetical protein VF131_19935 [Blastocatellia bacterium]|nr:hypothetical protein [Blastocatellia bacterium]
MQRINKQTTAPFGLAFIFLGLAIVPVSLKAVGVNFNFTPRVNAVASAWARITGGAVSAYQPLGTVELSALNLFDCCEESNPVEETTPAEEPSQMACLEEQGAPVECEQADKAVEMSPVSSLEPQSKREKSAPRMMALAKRDVIARTVSRSGRKFEISVIDVESIVEPIVASQAELASLVEKRVGRYRFNLKNVKGVQAPKTVKLVFEAPPSTLFERDVRRSVRSEKDCDSSAKPERLRTKTTTPVLIEWTETKGE